MILNGYKMTDEHKRKISLALIGRKNPKISLAKMGHSVSEETRRKISLAKKGVPSPTKGRKFPPEFGAKISARLKGRVGTNKGKTFSAEARANMSKARKGHSGPNKGKTFSPEYRAKLREAHLGQVAWNKGLKGVQKSWNKGKPSPWMKGEKNCRWKGGVTAAHRLERASIQAREWREAVLARDAFTCQHCGQIGGKLQADHIRIWAHHPELRFDVSNGQTLCKSCHSRKTSTDMKEYWVTTFSKQSVQVSAMKP
jgi:5-methylcytosine-specific restriction endonuclease McrA